MSKKKSNMKNFGANLILILIGALCGVIMVVYLDGIFEEYGFFLSLLFKLLIFFVTYYVQLIIHEAGHLVAGLLTGYSFGSFRAGSIIIVKENGKLKIKKQTIAGTGGQCLMIPPKMVDGDFPVILYNLGGVLMNLLTLPICVFAIRFLIGKPVLYTFCVFTFLSGLIIALTNGIPLKLGMVNNDGSNALELRRDREARIAFYNQFMILDKIRRGVRLKDMSSEYFPMPSDEGMKNSISASAAVFLENRLMDSQSFDEAHELINKLLNMDSALIGLHKNLLICDKILILLMRGDNEGAQKLYSDKGYREFSKQMKTFLSVIRTEYAFAKLFEKDEKKAKEIWEKFEKCAKTHPYSIDVESERELLVLVDSLCKNQ